MSLNIKFSYLAENSKFSRSNSYFSILTPTFLRDGFLNSCFQNPSENSDRVNRVKRVNRDEKRIIVIYDRKLKKRFIHYIWIIKQELF